MKLFTPDVRLERVTQISAETLRAVGAKGVIVDLDNTLGGYDEPLPSQEVVEWAKGIVAAGAYSSLAYTLKTLLTNGVNVLQALKICEETCGNAVIGDALHTARQRVTDGTTISGPLASSGVFPRMMTDMLAIGEQAGDMPSNRS